MVAAPSSPEKGEAFIILRKFNWANQPKLEYLFVLKRTFRGEHFFSVLHRGDLKEFLSFVIFYFLDFDGIVSVVAIGFFVGAIDVRCTCASGE